MLAGAIRGWWLYAAPGRLRTLVSLGLWLFFVENVLFPNQHQEYGVLSLAAYRAGHTTAEPSLLDFARSQGQTPTQFMLPVPSWVHPTWLICAGLLALVVARKVVGLRWTATTIAGAYLAYRGVACGCCWSRPASRRRTCRSCCWSAPCSSTWRSPAACPGWVAGLVVAAGSTASGRGQEALGLLPPWNWWSALPGRRRLRRALDRGRPRSAAAAGWPAGGSPSSPALDRLPARTGRGPTS